MGLQHGQRLGIGRVVHFVMADESIRAGQVARIWGSDPTGADIAYTQGAPAGMYPSCQLIVTLDGQNDLHYTLEQMQAILEQYVNPEFGKDFPGTHQLTTKRARIEAFIASYGHVSPIFSFQHHHAEDPDQDGCWIYAVTVNGWFAWATSVSYDPYTWRPFTWHWPQDPKLPMPEHMQPVATA